MRASTASCPRSTPSASPRLGRRSRRTAHLARAKALSPGLGLVVQPHHVSLLRTTSVVAGRIAVDLGRANSLVSVAGARQLLQLAQSHPLEREDLLLGLRAAPTIVADHPVRSHHAVTRDEVGDRIVGERGTNRANRPRMTDLARDPTVWPNLPARNLTGLAQYGLLELGQAAQVEPKPAPSAQLAGEPGREVGGGRPRRQRPPPPPLQPLPQPLVRLRPPCR